MNEVILIWYVVILFFFSLIFLAVIFLVWKIYAKMGNNYMDLEFDFQGLRLTLDHIKPKYFDVWVKGLTKAVSSVCEVLINEIVDDKE